MTKLEKKKKELQKNKIKKTFLAKYRIILMGKVIRLCQRELMH